MRARHKCVLCKIHLSNVLTTCLAFIAVCMISIIQRQKEKNMAIEYIIEGGITFFPFSEIVVDSNTASWSGKL